MSDPPRGLWQAIDVLLAHERELWDSGIDAPEWYPQPRADGDPQH